MSIGERIIELRNARNISQAQLASLLDISRQAVSKWENDLSAPDTLNLIRLADILCTDVEYLATGNHTTIKEPPQILRVIQNVDRVVEKVIEKPVMVEKIVEVEKVVEVEKLVETIVEKPKIKKVQRIKYIRNPIEYAVIAFFAFLFGVIIGYLL